MLKVNEEVFFSKFFDSIFFPKCRNGDWKACLHTQLYEQVLGSCHEEGNDKNKYDR